MYWVLVQVICLSPNAVNISDGNPHRLLKIDRPRLTCTCEQCRSHPGVQPKATWTLVVSWRGGVGRPPQSYCDLHAKISPAIGRARSSWYVVACLPQHWPAGTCC